MYEKIVDKLYILDQCLWLLSVPSCPHANIKSIIERFSPKFLPDDSLQLTEREHKTLYN